jgi:hypothetical protein
MAMAEMAVTVMKWSVVQYDPDGAMKSFWLDALYAVIRRYKLKPINGEYQISEEMLAEAAAYDERHGTRPSTPPESLADLKATIEGKPNSGKWKETDLNEIAHEENLKRSKIQ